VFEDMVFEKNIGHFVFCKVFCKIQKKHKCILYFKYICKKQYFTKYSEILFTIVFYIQILFKCILPSTDYN